MESLRKQSYAYIEEAKLFGSWHELELILAVIIEHSFNTCLPQEEDPILYFQRVTIKLLILD